MKKTILAISSSVIIFSACSKEHLNKKIDTIGSIGTYQIGETEEYNIDTRQKEPVPVFMSVKIDSVIDDITPKNPDALMPADYKSIKVFFTTENKQKKLSETDIYVFDSKAKKEYLPTLRDNESKFSNSGGFFIVDVPNITLIEDLTIGLDDITNKNKTHEGYINLKPKTINKSENFVVKLDSSIYNESVLYEGGKTKTTIKSITYNVDAKDKNIDAMTRMVDPSACFVRVDVEFELVEGEECSIYSLNYLFTQYREVFSVKETNSLPSTIVGKGTVIKTAYYFSLWPGETVNYIAERSKEAEIIFKINLNAK